MFMGVKNGIYVGKRFHYLKFSFHESLSLQKNLPELTEKRKKGKGSNK